MKRVLTSIGVGSATVDTVLPAEDLRPGQTVAATVELTGGDTTQEIERIYFALNARVDADDGTEQRTVAEFDAEQGVSLGPAEERSVPVEFAVPLWTPLTRAGASVWLETGLEIDWARDPTDEDEVLIVPDEYSAAMFDALDELEFELRHTELVETPYLDDRPFAQEFDFRPTDEQFGDDLDELEVTLMPREDDLRVFVEFDQRDAVAAEYDADFDEQEVPMTFDRADAGAIRRELVQAFDQYA